VTVTTHHRPATAHSGPAIEAHVRPVYRERAQLVAELATRWRAVRVDRAPDLPALALVQAHTPAGSMSWHIDREHDAELLAGIKRAELH
jgi:hypothetical protein